MNRCYLAINICIQLNKVSDIFTTTNIPFVICPFTYYPVSHRCTRCRGVTVNYTLCFKQLRFTAAS
jgi:hypothetical protein